MTKEQADYMKDLLLQYEIYCEVRYDYSGRGMFGQTTSAIVVDSILDVLHAVLQNHHDIENDGSPNFRTRFKTDNMGQSIVLY